MPLSEYSGIGCCVQIKMRLIITNYEKFSKKSDYTNGWDSVCFYAECTGEKRSKF